MFQQIDCVSPSTRFRTSSNDQSGGRAKFAPLKFKYLADCVRTARYTLCRYPGILNLRRRQERSRFYRTRQESTASVKSEGNVPVAIASTPLWEPDWFVGWYDDTVGRNDASRPQRGERSMLRGLAGPGCALYLTLNQKGRVNSILAIYMYTRGVKFALLLEQCFLRGSYMGPPWTPAFQAPWRS